VGREAQSKFYTKILKWTNDTMINFEDDTHVMQNGEKMTEEKKMTFPLYKHFI
jgi:hypothetical protein